MPQFPQVLVKHSMLTKCNYMSRATRFTPIVCTRMPWPPQRKIFCFESNSYRSHWIHVCLWFFFHLLLVCPYIHGVAMWTYRPTQWAQLRRNHEHVPAPLIESISKLSEKTKFAMKWTGTGRFDYLKEKTEVERWVRCCLIMFFPTPFSHNHSQFHLRWKKWICLFWHICHYLSILLCLLASF